MVKIFNHGISTSDTAFEDEINEWIKKKDRNIKFVNTISSTSGYITYIIITYEQQYI